MNRKYIFGILLIAGLCMLLFRHFGGAFAIYTDYQTAHIHAESGVALSLLKEDGIAEVSQTGCILEEQEAGWYKSGEIAFIEAAVEPGYEFVGWFENGVKLSEEMAMNYIVEKYAELTAKAKLKSYSLTFVPNGGEMNGEIPLNYTIMSEKIILPIPIKDGYQFEGWYTSEDFSGEAETELPKGSTGDRIYYAKWKKTATGDAYALILNHTTDSANRYPMIFVKSEDVIKAGDTYNSSTYGSLKVSYAYTGFEDVDYDAVSTVISAKRDSVAWANQKLQVTSVVVEDAISPVSTAFWFYGFQKCKRIDVSNLDTSRLTNTAYTFYGSGYQTTAFALTGLKNWDVSKVTNMAAMFRDLAYKATDFVLTGIADWNVSNVTDMYEMFDACGGGASSWYIDNLGKWDTGKVTNMGGMFYKAGYNATEFRLEGLEVWDTSNVTDMSDMFYSAGTKSATFDIGDLSNWNVGAVTTMEEMFRQAGQYAQTWKIGDLSKWNVSGVMDMDYMFYNAGADAESFDIGNLDNWNVGSVNDMTRMFYYAGYSARTYNIGDLSRWDVADVTGMEGMFYGSGYSAAEWSIGDLSGWQTGEVINMSYMFCNAGYSADWSLDLSGWNVAKVTNYRGFNQGVTAKVTEPVWP